MKSIIVFALFFMACSSVKSQSKPGISFSYFLPSTDDTLFINTDSVRGKINFLMIGNYVFEILHAPNGEIDIARIAKMPYSWEEAWYPPSWYKTHPQFDRPWGLPDDKPQGWTKHDAPPIQRLSILEKQVAYLVRRTNELEQEIKALKPKEDTAKTMIWGKIKLIKIMVQEIIITREQALVIKDALEGIILLAEKFGPKDPLNERVILQYLNEKLGCLAYKLAVVRFCNVNLGSRSDPRDRKTRGATLIYMLWHLKLNMTNIYGEST